MEPDFWHKRWQDNAIGFHETRGSRCLRNHWHQLNINAHEQVFVPLCGKTADMCWLMQQNVCVLGIELSPLASDAFFQENQLEIEKTETIQKAGKGFTHRYSGLLQLITGNFFHLDKIALQSVNLVYDRAALVALPSELREQYCQHLQQNLPANARIFLITLEYPVGDRIGPPFSIDTTEVNRLFGNTYHVNCLGTTDLTANPDTNHGCFSQLYESAFLLSPRPA